MEIKSLSYRIVITVLSLFFSFLSFSQTFIEQTGISLSGIIGSSTSWGDYDNDGDLDILLTGYSTSGYISRIYRNNGNNSFTLQSGINLVGVRYGSSAWGDYNNDGFLDILLTGSTSASNISKIYKNNGDNSFTEQTEILLTGVSQSSVAWGDFDDDGDLDILLTGYSGSAYISKIYRNNGDGSFTELTEISLTKVRYSAVALGDYDNDNDLDILLTGYTGSLRVSKIYSNNGDNIFTEQSNIILPGVQNGSVAWGDYDSDGYLDILLTGNTGTQYISKIYRNNGDNSFTEQTEISLYGIYQSSVSWGDFDNDGDLDILMSGNGASNSICKIYKNNGNNSFTEYGETSFPGVQYGSAQWGDYDNDGDLDFFLTGNSFGTYIAKIYRNNSSLVNTTPSTPNGLETSVLDNDIIFKWSPVSDDNTPSKTISYNIKIGTSSGTINITSPHSDNNGFRRIVTMGNAQLDTTYSLKNLKKGNYYWRVQAIDNGYKSSPFSNENLVYIGGVQVKRLSASKIDGFRAFLNWKRGNLDSCIVFVKKEGDSLKPIDNVTYISSPIYGQGSETADGWYCVYNGSADSVWVSGLEGVTSYTVQVFEYEGNPGTEKYITTTSTENLLTFITGSFSEQTNISLTGVGSSSVSWGDYDNDGRSDILLTGYTGSKSISKIYHNEGNNAFSEQTGIALTGVRNGSSAWSDYNNDGYLDILITGYTGTQSISKIYRNNGDNTFTEQTGISLVGVSSSSVAWADYDNDGDQDILLTGSTSSGGYISKIYRNNADNTFTDQPIISLKGISMGSTAWGDYDNDGDLDILLTGMTNSSSSLIYKNENDHSFILQDSIAIKGVSNSSVSWGDYDNDGDLDILLTGGGKSIIYCNKGNNSFTVDTNVTLPGVGFCSSAMGDYDNDGDLDILLTGQSDNFKIISKIFRNDGKTGFTEQTDILLIGVQNSSVAWGDYDNDGDLDILLTGFSGTNYVSKIYRNDGKVFNIAPPAPVGIEQTVSDEGVILKWGPVSEDNTSSNSITYNVRVGTSSEAINIVSPHSDNNGFRRIVTMGNAQLDTTYSLKNLKIGNYYWSVQAIDNSFTGSLFSEEGTYTVSAIQARGLTTFNVEGSTALLFWERGNLDKCVVFVKEGIDTLNPANNLTYYASEIFGRGTSVGNGWFCVYNGTSDSMRISGLKGNTNYSVQVFEYEGVTGAEQYFNVTSTENPITFKTSYFTEQTDISIKMANGGRALWGDFNNDGHLDIFINGNSDTLYSIIYRNNGDNTFTELTSLFLEGVIGYDLAWGDYDNDGLLDVFLSNNTVDSKGIFSRVDKLYHNDGNFNFSEQAGVSFGEITGGSAEWGDYDNDGYLDLLISGSMKDVGWVTKIYRNNRNNSFTELTNIDLDKLICSSGSWGDYDNDGDLDILLCGSTDTYKTKVYQNNGDNSFTEQINISLPAVLYCSGIWVDYDNDGYNDIVITGWELFKGDLITKVFKNSGENNFIEQADITFPGIGNGNSAWSDFNNDGNLDALITGITRASGITKLYQNKGENTFEESTNIILNQVEESYASWGDYDNDGDLDILLNGRNKDVTTKIYRNDIIYNDSLSNPDKKPLKPVQLKFRQAENRVLLTWIGDTTDETPEISMSYNIAFGKSKDSLLYGPPHSNDTLRTIVENGNTGLNNFYKPNLPLGKYYWKVQAVDGGYKGGEWSEIDSFDIIQLLPPELYAPANLSTIQTINPKFIWYAGNGIGSYTIQVSDSSSFNNLIVNENVVTDTFYFASGLQQNIPYYWRVKIKDSEYSTSWSEIYSFSINNLTLEAPLLISPRNNSIDQITSPTLYWTSVSGALDYSLEVSVSPTFETSIINESNLTDTSYYLSELDRHTTYYWHVNATSSIGTSTWSDNWEFTTYDQESRILFFESDEYSVFPNPFSNKIIIKCSANNEFQIIVYSITGNVLSELVASEGTYTLDMSTLPKGVYLLKLSNEQGNFIQKITKQ